MWKPDTMDKALSALFNEDFHLLMRRNKNVKQIWMMVAVCKNLILDFIIIIFASAYYGVVCNKLLIHCYTTLKHNTEGAHIIIIILQSLHQYYVMCLLLGTTDQGVLLHTISVP